MLQINSHTLEITVENLQKMSRFRFKVTVTVVKTL